MGYTIYYFGFFGEPFSNSFSNSLGALLVFTFMQNYYESKLSQQAVTPTTETRQVADEQTTPETEAPESPVATAKIAETPEDKLAEPTATPQTTPPAEASPEAQSVAPAEATPQPQAEEPTQPAPTEATDAVTVAASTNSTYVYAAQPGDSYSVLARKAIQTYGLNNKTTLSPAQITAAEAFLTAQAGSPELNEAQQVTISIDSVKSAVDNAQKLSTNDLAAWNVYAQNVDFNTNANG